MILLTDMLQNCWLSDKVTLILCSQNSSENNLFLLNCLPTYMPPNDEEAPPLFFFSNLLQKFTCSSYLTLRISSVTLQKYQLSFSIKSMLNRESLFFTELQIWFIERDWDVSLLCAKWLRNLYRCKGPMIYHCLRIKCYISDNSLLYPRCHACSIEPSLVDNLLLKMQTPVCRRQRNDVKRGTTEKCAFKSCSDNIKFSKYQSAFLR